MNNNKIQAFSTELLLKISDIIVKKFIKNGSIKYDDFEDIRQSLIEKYLNKKDKIESSFNGSAKIETYISAVLYRMVLEILRSKKSEANNNSKFEESIKFFNTEKVINPEEQLIIENEKKYLQRVLQTLGKEQFKISLFIKYYFRIIIKSFDLNNYVPSNLIKSLLKILTFEINTKDKEIFSNLSEVQNSFETKKVKPDAVRMFINKNIERIINRMNGTKRAFYTKDTLSILFEMYHN